MANPLILFENILEDGTLTVTSESASYPKENMLDWRMATPFRWTAGATTWQQQFTVDLGSGSSNAADTLVIGGHDLPDTDHANGCRMIIEPSDDGTFTDLSNVVDANDYATALQESANLPVVAVWDQATSHRYWRVSIQAGTIPAHQWSSVPSIGIMTLGRRIELDGALADIGAYDIGAVVEDSTNENGSPLGVNARYRRKMFNLNYAEPGMTKTDFFQPSSGLTFDGDFVAHAITAGKPFWFAWNTDEEAQDVWLCKTRNIASPFIGSTARRGLFAQFEAYRETA